MYYSFKIIYDISKLVRFTYTLLMHVLKLIQSLSTISIILISILPSNKAGNLVCVFLALLCLRHILTMLSTQSLLVLISFFFFITDWLNLCSLLLTSHFLCSNSLCYLLQYCLFQRGFVTDNISECLECVKMPYFTFLRVSWYWAPSVVQNGNETLNIYSIYHFQRRRV